MLGQCRDRVKRLQPAPAHVIFDDFERLRVGFDAEVIRKIAVIRDELVYSEGILVNEIAPRPHNSGHCTIEAAAASQFEQQLRAVTGQPLGDGSCAPAAMAQLLGDLWDDGEPDWTAALARPGVHLHLYGKREARTGRKMGHLTVISDDATDALQRVLDARAALNER